MEDRLKRKRPKTFHLPRRDHKQCPDGAMVMAVVGLFFLPFLFVSLAIAWDGTDKESDKVRILSIAGLVAWAFCIFLYLDHVGAL